MAYYATYQQDETGVLQKVVINAGVGFVLPYYGETAPPGTLACDGSEISRTVYDELFQVLGTKAGAGDGVSTFNLPDFRGDFIRGLGGDNAGALGVEQDDAIRDITGDFMVRPSNDTASTVIPSLSHGAFTTNISTFGLNVIMTGVDGKTGEVISFDVSRVVQTAAENRPINVALLWCIIYE